MYLGKLTDTLTSLNKQQIKALKVYLASPYFGTRSIAVDLFEYLYKQYPEFEDKLLSPDKIKRHVKSLYTVHIQKKAASELLKAIEHFLAIENWEQNQQAVSLYKLKALQQQHLFESFEREYKTAGEELLTAKEQDHHAFLQHFLLTELSYNNFTDRANRKDNHDLTPVFTRLNEFHALTTVFYLCEAHNRHVTFGTPLPSVNYQQLFETLKPYNNSRHPFAYLFITALHMQLATGYTESLRYYNVLKNEITKQKQLQLPVHIRTVIPYCVQWCVQWLNRGNTKARIEYLWWAEFKIAHRILLEKDKIFPVAFVNIISTALRNGKPAEWIKGFIDTYSPHLPDGSAAFTDFGNGLYYYHVKDYTNALRHIRKAQLKTDMVYYAVLRRWEFIISFELGADSTEALLNQLKAYGRFVQRNKKELAGKEAVFERFIHYASRFLQLKETQMQSWLNQLKGEEYFPGKEWLLTVLPKKSPWLTSYRKLCL
ncbi:MAG: hypothetical protein KIS94_08705 [Chitinophagales bacterium]|nr:hypothetical protein [Chitinophagales bacterium]